MAFNGRFVFGMIHFASKQGADIKALVDASGHSADDLCLETCKLESYQYNAVLELAVQQTQDDFFGLHFGESMNMVSAGLVAQITQSCETIKQALDYACEFAQLACSSLPMQLEERKNDYKLSMNPEPVWQQESNLAVKQTVDGTLVFTLNEYQELTRKQHYPIKIHLPFSRPKSTLEYERLLKCPIHFDKDEIALFFEKSHIEEKVITSDYNLLRVLVAHAEERIAVINQDLGFFEMVKASVANLVKPQFPTIEEVASHFNISVRTLQRRLAEEGHNFKEIIETLRKDFAMAYLKKPELSINEIAYLLSYTDASGFIRSFKRWTGTTPQEYRRT